ncbi:uncharacterized protein METZ01_LOCUS52750 [marine metagenome]|uniref:Uncharacterized protein n=1 Tax=marine metagenome TaxID=408172 RepID=A0A381S761_9ZZZZ
MISVHQLNINLGMIVNNVWTEYK